METFVVWLLDKAMLVVPEKKRMAAFSFLKKILRQVLNFFRKAIKTAELETIQETHKARITINTPRKKMTIPQQQTMKQSRPLRISIRSSKSMLFLPMPQ